MNASTLNHAIRHVELAGLDIGRLAGTGDDVSNDLIADCIEHHRQIANKLRHIQSLAAGKSTLANAMHGNLAPMLDKLSAPNT